MRRACATVERHGTIGGSLALDVTDAAAVQAAPGDIVKRPGGWTSW
jgi:hypothetical protein